jgi:DNA (cytosine-5)-methyltransferase 1
LKTKQRKPNGRARHAAGLFDEMVVDSFAGGGGASLGIERALGRAVDVAINHDPIATAVHRANHPATLHYCDDIWHADPLKVTQGRPVGLLWASPDCKHFSRAKGGKPVEKRIRGLAWVVIRWAKAVRPRVICLENVREFRDWGPLTADNRPCPHRKGLTFKRWVGTLRNLGYSVEWRDLNAADFGAPTHRHRLFLVARRDRAPIAWPEPTHGPGRSAYRTAAECIDWSLPCPSIFLTREEAKAIGVIRPLAEKTMRRIAMGLRRYVLENPKPFIVRVDHGGDHFRGQPIGQPLSAVTSHHGYGVVAPFLTAQYGERPGQEPRSHPADQPIPVVTPRGGGGFPLIAAALTPAEFRGQSAEQPLGTVTSVARPVVIAPYLAKYYGVGEGDKGEMQGCDRPASTLTASPKHALIAPALVQYNQEKGNETRGQGVETPLKTVVTENRFALVAAFLAKFYGGVVGHEPDRPLGTVTAIDHHAIAAANLIKMNFGDKQWSPADEPLRTILAGANHHGLVMACLTKFYGTGTTGQPLDDALHTVTSRDRFGLVTVEGQDFLIADIGLRMLTPRELFRAQGFPDEYRIEIEYQGKPLSKTAQVRLCGNSVCPDVAEALVRANYAAEEAEQIA